MGGFGSGRHGGTVTAEGTASYVLTASMLTGEGRGATGVAHFDGDSFWVAIRVDISDPSDAFIELTHQTRDEREGDRIVPRPHSAGLDRTGLWRTRLAVSMPAILPEDHEALPAKWRTPFLEPPSRRPRVCVPARRSLQSSPGEEPRC